jgi:uncharacterized protein with GYD domain
MPMYLFRGKYTSEAFKAMIAKPHDRTEGARKVVEAAGGKLHHLFFAFGEYDVIALVEHPDNASYTATVMALAASGAFAGGETTVLMTAAEAQAAMTKASAAAAAYVPATKA